MKLIEEVLSKDNLNEAYKQVVRNKGASEIDEMTCEEVKEYLKIHGNDLINQILSRKYQPFPVKRVEIPKPNGGIRKLGIPTVVDRITQQALVQKLTPIFEPTFSDINRVYYLNQIISKMWDGNIKVITGIRRCGKSILLFELFYDYLIIEKAIN